MTGLPKGAGLKVTRGPVLPSLSGSLTPFASRARLSPASEHGRGWRSARSLARRAVHLEPRLRVSALVGGIAESPWNGQARSCAMMQGGEDFRGTRRDTGRGISRPKGADEGIEDHSVARLMALGDAGVARWARTLPVRLTSARRLACLCRRSVWHGALERPPSPCAL